MKIGNSHEVAAAQVGADKAAAAQTGRTQANGAAGGAGATKKPEASAQIELSSTASKLLSGVSDEGSFDAEKVGRISQAIADGKFSVNADAIADKLISNAQELISRTATH